MFETLKTWWYGKELPEILAIFHKAEAELEDFKKRVQDLRNQKLAEAAVLMHDAEKHAKDIFDAATSQEAIRKLLNKS